MLTPSKTNKTDLDEVKPIRHKRYLKHNKEYNEKIKNEKNYINVNSNTD